MNMDRNPVSYLGPSSFIFLKLYFPRFHVLHLGSSRAEMEPEKDNSITSALRDAISRIEWLEGQQHQLSLSHNTPVSSSDSSKGSDHTASNTASTTSSGTSRPTRPFLPMRRGAAASPMFFNINNRPIRPSSAPVSLANREETVTNEFR